MASPINCLQNRASQPNGDQPLAHGRISRPFVQSNTVFVNGSQNFNGHTSDSQWAWACSAQAQSQPKSLLCQPIRVEGCDLNQVGLDRSGCDDGLKDSKKTRDHAYC
ncbi:hypothetical protein AMTR_s00057p00136860 [Amborella trichopoda]|uniref:Uncharacterized protein n=1 Tax=Amborella trichopoda TaxID=13333 RepID=U5D347_AMBTC|nr:hypothetical protein AMTR_s00057p00136860 [Amborella trichopoda]